MRSIIKHIPNAITCLNLLAGCLACVAAFWTEYNMAAYFVALAAIFDFADGFAARLLNAYSSLGKELDSLADMVSFGLAPAIMLFSVLVQFDLQWALLAFLLTIFSAIRLAKFNIDNRQTSSFIGLPTPANAFFWVFLLKDIQYLPVLDAEGLRMIDYHYHIGSFSCASFPFVVIIIFLIGIFCFLMVSEIPMFSLKFKTFEWKGNEIRYTFLAISLTLILLMKTTAFPLIIGIYILTSIFSNLICRKKTDDIMFN